MSNRAGRPKTPLKREAKAPTPPPRESVSGMSRVAYLRQSLDELEGWAQEAAAQGSWQAVGKLKADAIKVKSDLEEALEREAGPTDQMSDDDLVALIQRAIATVPEAHLEVIEDALAFRRGPARGAVVQ